MALKTVGTTLSRTLWARGNRTPPIGRSPKGSRLSTTSCRELGGTKQQQEEKNSRKDGQSCGSESSHSSSEPPHSKCPSGDKKRLKDAVGAPGVPGVRRRCFTSKAAPMDQTSYLWTRYNDMKRLVYGKHTGGALCPLLHPPPSEEAGNPPRHQHLQLFMLASGTFCTFQGSSPLC